MSITYNPQERLLTLETAHTSYWMRVDEFGHLIHVYYGRKLRTPTAVPQPVPVDRGFSPNYYDTREDRTLSPDILCQEYGGFHNGDFRIGCAEVYDGKGAGSLDLRYVRHEIRPGKYQLNGLPSVHAPETKADTLSVRLRDEAMKLEVELLYGVVPDTDTITRCAVYRNTGDGILRIEKAASCCLDIPTGKWDMIHFHGRHTMERQMERVPLMQSVQSVGSRRGASSHHHNPFLILCAPETTEDFGDCFGLMLLYSGSHKSEVEVDQMGQTRVVSGIYSVDFSWILKAGESFETPECAMIYSENGLSSLSHCYHHLIGRYICRGKYALTRRPILINSWEAAYFDFDEKKLLCIAQEAAKLGVEMFVLDDGWFGKRNDDCSGLGDWNVNEEKLHGGMGQLIENINQLGLKFGLWIEPEMVNEDSNLFRKHPDWALTVPGRKPVLGRNQLVLDLSRQEVVDYLYEQFAQLLSKYKIDYIKWDMNRNIADIYSCVLPPEQQGEVLHRYILGLYQLLGRLTSQFPEVLFESCSGGGGRFDAGMLYYTPQIWCSDNTDAIERLSIQYGTSFGYPVSTMGSHVSAVPNHQTGRTTPLGTRAVVAMSGTFGYELNPEQTTEEEKEEIRKQIKTCIRYSSLIQSGEYYRLSGFDGEQSHTAWQFASNDRKEALLNAVVTHTASNAPPICVRLKGLDPDAMYRVENECFFGCVNSGFLKDVKNDTGDVFSGGALMYSGYYLPPVSGDYPSIQVHFVRCENEQVE